MCCVKRKPIARAGGSIRVNTATTTDIYDSDVRSKVNLKFIALKSFNIGNSSRPVRLPATSQSIKTMFNKPTVTCRFLFHYKLFHYKKHPSTVF